MLGMSLRPEPGSASVTRWMAAVFVLALLARLAYLVAVLHLESPLLVQYDDGEYHVLAKCIVAGHGMAMGNGPTAVKSPGYPWFLGGVYAMFGPHPGPVRLIQAVLGAATAALLLPLALELGLGLLAAVVAGFVAAAYPSAIYLVGRYFPMVLNSLLLVVSALALVRWSKRGGAGIWLSAIALAVSALVRAESLVLVPLLALVTFVLCADRRRAVRGALVLIGCSVVLYAPWVVRNELRFGHLIVGTSTAQDVSWQGNNPWSNGGYVLQDDILARFAGQERPADLPPGGQEQLDGLRRMYDPTRALNEVQRDSANAELALRWRTHYPGAFARNMLLKVVVFLSPWPGQGGPILWRFRYLIVLSSGPVMLLGLLGFLAARDRGPGRWLVFAVFAQALVVTLVTFGHTRFRFSLEVLLMPYAAFGLAWLLARLRRRPALAR